MIPFWKKTDKGGKKPPKPAVPHTAQQSIPMQRMFEDGTCRVKPNYYTRTIAYQDINYQLAQQEDKTAIFEEWCSFLNFFDSSILTSAVCTTPFTSASLPRSWSGMELVTTRKSRRRMNKVHGSWAAKVISLSSPVMMAGITPFIIAIFP